MIYQGYGHIYGIVQIQTLRRRVTMGFPEALYKISRS